MQRLLCIVLAGCLGLFAGCGNEMDGPAVSRKDAAPASHPFTPRLDEVEFTAELAVTLTEQQKGLMHRASMPPDHGMLFLYEAPQQMGFWMKNTLIPLDIGFFSAEGELLQVARMYPRDRTTKESASDAVQFALEMNQGWFREHGLKPGATLDLDAVRDGLAARGFDPKNFGL